MMGLPIDSWFWFIGVRVLSCFIGLVLTIFCVYEGKDKDREIEEAGGGKDAWYWTF